MTHFQQVDRVDELPPPVESDERFKGIPFGRRHLTFPVLQLEPDQRIEDTAIENDQVDIAIDRVQQTGEHRTVGRLAQRHDVVAIRLFDPLEMALPDVGLVTVEDAETGEQLFIDSTDPAFRARYAALADAAEAKLATAFARAGVDCLELATDDDLLAALLRFADLRRRRVFGAHAPPVAFATHLSPTPAAVSP
jgi:uncharacterized protein (DUF58 family)